MQSSSVVVTLVHGTFSGVDASWCSDQSPLRRELASTFGGAVTVTLFRWSGENAHYARLEAGELLSTHLSELVEHNPNAQHVIVSHSHGGNVVAYALRGETLRRHITCLVFIATPFIRCEARDLHATSIFSIAALAACCGLLAMVPAVITGGLVRLATGQIGEWPFHLTYIVVLLASFWRLFSRVRNTLSAIWPWLERQQQAILSKYTLPFLDHARVLVVGTAMDEAGLWLRSLRVISMIPFVLWRPGLLAYEYVGFVALLFIAAALSNVDITPLGDIGIPQLLTFISAAVLIPAIPFLGITALLQVLMFLTPKLIRGQSWGFGGETFLDNVLVDISTTDQPSSASVDRLRPTISRIAWGRHKRVVPALQLGHCEICIASEVVGGVVEWLRFTLDGSVPPFEQHRASSAANPLEL